jgi:perosamine synthetase
MTVFSFHPVKHVATGEGGMIVTDDPELAAKMRLFRSHGITTDARQREQSGAWFYEMVDLGYNYRITDIQCALGITQLRKLDAGLARRRQIASIYDRFFADNTLAAPLAKADECVHAYHLYVLQVRVGTTGTRNQLFSRLRECGIGVNVHYVPVHLHPYYRDRFGYGKDLCPVAEHAADRILSIPMFPGLSDADVDTVLSTFTNLMKEFS